MRSVTYVGHFSLKFLASGVITKDVSLIKVVT